MNLVLKVFWVSKIKEPFYRLTSYPVSRNHLYLEKLSGRGEKENYSQSFLSVCPKHGSAGDKRAGRHRRPLPHLCPGPRDLLPPSVFPAPAKPHGAQGFREFSLEALGKGTKNSGQYRLTSDIHPLTVVSAF